jgi:hypothetical protein
MTLLFVRLELGGDVDVGAGKDGFDDLFRGGVLLAIVLLCARGARAEEGDKGRNVSWGFIRTVGFLLSDHRARVNRPKSHTFLYQSSPGHLLLSQLASPSYPHNSSSTPSLRTIRRLGKSFPQSSDPLASSSTLSFSSSRSSHALLFVRPTGSTCVENRNPIPILTRSSCLVGSESARAPPDLGSGF